MAEAGSDTEPILVDGEAGQVADIGFGEGCAFAGLGRVSSSRNAARRSRAGTPVVQETAQMDWHCGDRLSVATR